MTGPAVEVRDLRKIFPHPEGGSLTAVDGVSFSVERGEVFGFLGPNGAGKTTTLEIIEGLQEPTAGTTRVLGLDSRKERARVKQRIGVQLQAGAYFDYLTLEEILELFGSFYRRSVPPGDLLARVGLEEKRRALVRQLSGGQAQRFSIVAALVNDPEVVFLDEPTTGLDPQARRNLWEVVRSINADGKTVVLTTHYMEEAEVLCDRVAIIDHGRIQALDSPLGLIRRLPSPYRIRFAGSDHLEEGPLRSLPGVTGVAKSGNGRGVWELEASRPQEALAALLPWAAEQSVAIDDLQVLPATLEDVFLSVTGHLLRD